MNTLKQNLISTRYYKPLLNVRALYEFWLIHTFGNQDKTVRTRYCISPYKSGTTWFSGLFGGTSNSSHEPLMYTTISNIGNLNFMKKRANWLNLDLECSGFLAGKLPLIREFAPQSPVVFLSRHPEEWIGSVISYFGQFKRYSYNYVARLVFDDICRYPVDLFYELEVAQQRQVLTRLLEYWIEAYSQAALDNWSIIVPLEMVERRIGEISSFMELAHPPGTAIWKRPTKSKRAISLSEYLDVREYTVVVRELGYELS